MKLLFLMTHAGFARNFDTPLRTLAERGHQVTVLLERGGRPLETPRDQALTAIVGAYPGVEVKVAPPRQPGSYSDAGRALRTLADYGRYLEPAYAEAIPARERVASRLPPGLPRLARSRFGPRLLAAADRADRSLPVAAAVDSLLASEAPAVLVVTPLVELGSPQLEYVRAARRRRIPSALAVASWDNLTMKGGIHEAPDLVTVWNETQRREAADLHGVPEDRVEVTGAVAYDHWLEQEPGRSRDEFCRALGLDPGRPFVLYAGSSGFVAPDEGPAIAEWVAALAAHPGLEDVAVLYRPHPTNAYTLDGAGSPPDLVVHPRGGQDPQSAASRSVYADSLRHCAAVVGVNTSAMLEATLFDRPVLTTLNRFRQSQLGTLHFHHLTESKGGPLIVATDLPSHLDQLAAAVAAGRAPSAEFVGRFLRPNGVDRPASESLVDALERVALADPEPAPPPQRPTPTARLTRGALAVRRLLAGTKRGS